MQKRYSIAEARNKFTALIRDVEATDQPVQVTRRGEPVVVILSTEEYEKLQRAQDKRPFFSIYQEWRDKWIDESWEDESDPFTGLRDPSPSREVEL